ncbi:SusC/RagA family TonB-linked outer membrane protein [Fulvivirgaceae bacterium PWU4]|uniref:SusC/RagA family TonB-linked outer membrane protein n=1 Tax=Chryseosolibacter histidini TaxID=2782349 RepID=A0AAP2DPK0_9BACT|nr:SusC/RagA family TonB-linked outer membrane protein [Chryseosolibacter histidini]MBT1698998.1 SusC/RagA family TonB-linked outer membrane protein [Chryseosolibacter histidini]
MIRFFTRIRYLFIVAPVFFAGALQAQEATSVRGKVLDKGDNTPMAGVTVVEMDKYNRIISGVSTDLNGNYLLKNVNSESTIAFSFIGYTTIREQVNGRTVIDINLAPDVTSLAAVEVTATKTTSTGMMEINSRDLTTASATVTVADLSELQATSIDQALQGRMAGVDIVANSGDPGAGMSIRIRGTSSINQSSDPLIVVDGMPYDIEIASDFNFATATEQGYAQLLNIAPSDIKDITVLKDAAATAIWGSRASNGVLVINTLRGKVGKPTVNYTFKGTLTKQPDPIPMLSGDQYAMLIPEAFMNRDGRPLNTTTVKEFQYDPSDPYYYYNYSNNTNWIDAITQLGYLQDHNVSLQGGGEKASYFASLGYNKTAGTTIGTDFNRLNARVNLDFNVSSKIRFRSDLSYTHVDNDQIYNVSGKSNDPQNPRAIAYKKMPNMAVYEYDEYGNQTPNYFSPFFNIQGSFPNTYNPVALLRHGKSNNIGDRIRPVFNIQYEILPSVLLSTFDVAFDINNSKTSRFLPQIATGRPTTDTYVNRADDSDTDEFIVQTKFNLIYSPKIKNENHSLQALFSFLTYDNRGVSYRVVTSNSASSYFQDPSIPSRSQSTDLPFGSGISQSRSLGALVNVQYSLLDRYIVNAGIRRDGSSKFGAGHRFGNFPTASFRWRVSGEPFMDPLSNFISDLSFRASIGSSGNAPKDSYLHFGKYNSFSWNYLGMAGIYPANLELRDLRWETVTQQNFGLNLDVQQGKYIVNFDVYRKRTKDMFKENLPLPSVSGFPDVDMNVGVMDNNGWELSVSYNAIRTSDFNLRFDLNLARNFNIIRKISDLFPRTAGNITTNGEYLTILQVNNPFGSFYGFRYKGVYEDLDATIARDKDGKVILDANEQPIYTRFNYPVADYVFQPGDAKYEDINHDGNINELDVVYLGNANPRYTGGFGPSFTYKNFKFNMFFNFRLDYDIINSARMNTENMYSYDNQSTAVLRRWRKPGDQTDIPRALIGYGYNWLGSDRFVEDGSFVRLKYITLRYDFNPSVIKKIGANTLGVYVTLENLFTFTQYTGQDPEVSYKSGDAFSLGYDNALTPPLRSVTVGLAARF